MPRSIISRIFFLTIASYITLVALFVALPSFPSVHSGNYSHYHQDVLRSGRTLTSVHDRENIYPTISKSYYDGVRCFAIEWQLVKDEANQALLLGVGHGRSKKINLTNLAKTPLSPTSLTISEVIPLTAKYSYYGGGISLPWFDRADTCLIEWESSQETEVLKIRAITTSPGVVQIWPESTIWYYDPWYSSYMPGPDSDLKPFMTISNIPIDGHKANAALIQIDDMTWQVPTRTFRLRYAVFVFLKPITLTAAHIIKYWIHPITDLIEVIFDMVCKAFLIVSLIVFAFWLFAGRPPVREWILSLPTTKYLLRMRRGRIRETSSKINRKRDVVDGDNDDRNYPVYGVLNTPRDFFRSQAPLDDLLNTFETTRWMTRPLWRDQDLSRDRITHEQWYHHQEAC